VWILRAYYIGGSAKFFWLILSDQSLEGVLRTNFALMQYHNYSLSDIEGLIPWERDLYITMLLEHLEKEKQRQEEIKRKR
jgi:hypothetical protein